LIVEIFQNFRSEHMAAEGDPVADTIANQIVNSLPVPLPPKKKMNGREVCEMLGKILPVFRFKSCNGRAIRSSPEQA
jgi:hypothetical protein